MYLDIQADIKDKIAAAATTAAATVDGLDIEPFMARVGMGFELGLAIGVDVTTGIDILNDLLIPDIIERLEQLEEGVQGVERVRADSLQRCLGYVEDELRQIQELCSHESQRLWRMETFLMRGQGYRP
ncbi:hypothetical protein Tco_1349663 [Tanacetum coccineum]